MGSFIIALLPHDTWVLIFSFSLFFGLIFMTITILNGMGSDHDVDHDMDHDLDHDLDIDHDLDVDHDLDIDHNLDVDHDLDIDHDLDVDHDLSQGGDLLHTEHIDNLLTENQRSVKKSRYLMGNIMMFSTAFGATGMLYRNELTDFALLLSIGAGLVFAKLFAMTLAKIARNTNNPYIGISLGDEVVTVHEFDMKRKGIGNVTRRDGMVTTIITRGEYNSDIFRKGDLGYIVGKLDGEIYLVTESKQRVERILAKYSK